MSQVKKKAMLEALRSSLGIVTRAADLVGIDRRTHYRWMREDEQYKADVDDLQDVALDFAESRLHKLMDDGNAASIIFYLKTKGRHRGYVEKQEVVTKQPMMEWR